MTRTLTWSSLLGLALWSSASLACSCIPPGTPLEEMNRSTAVFQGTAVLVGGTHDLGRMVTFRVDQVWKGSVDPLISVKTPTEGSLCGYNFQAGVEYLVYVTTGGLVHSCGRTHPLTSASVDREALGAGAPVQSASIEALSRQAAFAGTWHNAQRSGEGFQVEILQDGRAVVTWFGYRPFEPQQQSWLVGVGTFEGTTLRIPDMQQPIGGGFGDTYDPNAVQRVVWGELILRFELDGTARMQWNSVLAGYRSGQFSLQRLTSPPRGPLPAAD